MRAYVVGGGPTADSFDWSEVDGVTIACHASAWRMPFAPTFQLSADRPYWERNAPRPGSIGVWVTVGDGGSRVHPDVARIHPISYDHWEHRWPSKASEGVMVGGCSGVAAMCFAYTLGADEIHLVGIDLDGEEARPWAKWQAAFRYAYNQCRLAGVKVICHGRWSP